MRSSSKKKVVFFTGARADYTAIRPLLFSLSKSSIKFILYISGMHTVNKLGNTLKDVKIPSNTVLQLFLLFSLRLAIKEKVAPAILVDAIYVYVV